MRLNILGMALMAPSEIECFNAVWRIGGWPLGGVDCEVAQWREWHDEGCLLVSKGHRGHRPEVTTVQVELRAQWHVEFFIALSFFITGQREWIITFSLTYGRDWQCSLIVIL